MSGAAVAGLVATTLGTLAIGVGVGLVLLAWLTRAIEIGAERRARIEGATDVVEFPVQSQSPAHEMMSVVEQAA